MFERKKEQNEAEHEESSIVSMHVLVIPLGSVASVLYFVFASKCKQRTAFVALPVRSSDSRHKSHVIESRESTPNSSQSGSIRIETTSQSGLTRFDWNRFRCRRDESSSIRIESGSKPDYFPSVEGPFILCRLVPCYFSSILSFLVPCFLSCINTSLAPSYFSYIQTCIVS